MQCMFGGGMSGRGIALLRRVVVVVRLRNRQDRDRLCRRLAKDGAAQAGAVPHRGAPAKTRRPEHGVLCLRCETGRQPDRQGDRRNLCLCRSSGGPASARRGETLFPGETKRDFSTESGRTYFFLVKSSARHDSVTGVTMVAGLAGALVASAATADSDNPGPAEFVPLDESTARTTLAELQLAE